MTFILHILTHSLAGVMATFFFIHDYSQFFDVFKIAIIGAVFIDIDHFFDYFKAFTKLDTKTFIKGYQFLQSKKIYVLFHSFELIIIFFILSLLFIKQLAPLFLASLFHLIQDVFINDMTLNSYFLLFRIKNKFSAFSLLKGEHLKRFKNELKQYYEKYKETK